MLVNAKRRRRSSRLASACKESKYPDQNGKPATSKSNNCFSWSLALTCFIRKYGSSLLAEAGTKTATSKDNFVLGQKYWDDITDLCNQTPYCLYLYCGVELEDDEEASVILLGFFDRATGENKIRFLDVFPVKEESADDICNYIVDALKKFRIPLFNMAIFYSNFPDHEPLLSGLKLLKPDIVSLCGLTDMAGQVCHSGVSKMEISDRILNLITMIYKHFPSFPATLQNLLEDAEGLNFNDLLTSQCSLFWRIIQKMTLAWSDLEEYFGSLDTDGKTISQHLSDRKIKLNVLFLTHALRPLYDFQKTIDQGVSVMQLLQDASQLLRFYTASFLRPKAAEFFHRRGKTSLVQETVGHLPNGEVEVGKRAADFLQQCSEELTDYLETFYTSIISFYTSVSVQIVELLPLPDSTLRSLSLVLSPGKKLEVTGKIIQELGVCFGVCSSPESVNVLTDEFLEYQFIEGDDTRLANQSMEQYWKTELRIMGKTSSFGKVINILLALPRMLKKEMIFEQLFKHSDHVKNGKTEGCEEDVAEDDVTDSSSYKSAPSHLGSQTQGSITFDVIDSREVEDIEAMEVKNTLTISSDSDTEKQNGTRGEHPYVSSNDDVNMCSSSDDDDDDYSSSDDDDVMWIKKRKGKILHDKEKTKNPYQGGYTVGEMVWGPIEGFGLWPGLVQRWDSKKPCGFMRKVNFFGNKMLSEVQEDDLQPYFLFAKCFCSNSFATVATYKDAIFSSLQVASRRSRMFFSPDADSVDELLRVMLNWAFGGFKPSGLDGLQPQLEGNEQDCIPRSLKRTVGSSLNNRDHREKLFNLTVSLNKLPECLDLHKGPVNLGNTRVYRKLMHPKWNQRSLNTVRTCREQKQRNWIVNRLARYESMEVGSRQNSRERHQMVCEFLENKIDIEEFCLSCGSPFVDIIHPLFEGSLCLKCKINFAETLYRYDEDGYQSYCTVCCSGMEVILCGHASCCRCYCVDCLDILVGKGTFDQLKKLDPWTCYLCAPESSSGALKPRHDWSIRVQEFFANNSAMEFEPHRVYPSIPAKQRRPIKVLSLFDGIATGYLVLRDLGFKVEKYVASEVDEESVTVSMVNHDGKITHVDDVKKITKKHIEKWGPFDLLIGGSPCNDLCTVNPGRKGLFEGSGRLFFEYYRLLNIMKPKEDDPRPFFWLFENVVLMENKVKADISRFLECNPVLVDAVKVSPAHRARYFWGNIPGMNRPIIASQNDKVTLQDCLDAGRTAKYEKIRTVTTRPNILKPGVDDRHYPIIMNGKDDSLWITELEKIFGFPKHYTDVKNLGRMQRQRVLGKSWSVPVIRHLLAPLKDYFAFD